MRTAKEIWAKIDELESRIVAKEKSIAEDKATINCMNHELIYAEIRQLMAQKLSLSWTLGNAIYF